MASSTYEQLVDAARDLDGAQQMSSPTARDKVVGQINTAMLIDIAASLRIIAESVAAPGAVVDEAGVEHVGELPDPGGETHDEVLEVGDRVIYLPEGDAAKADETAVGVIESIGTTEGEEFAVVSWDSDTVSRTWVKLLRRAEVEPTEADVDEVVASAVTEGKIEALTKAQKKAAKKGKRNADD